MALTIFLWVASVCVIILTALVGATAWFAITAALEVRRMVRRVRFAGKWVKFMSRRLMR
jgi:hypothetical protein